MVDTLNPTVQVWLRNKSTVDVLARDYA
jgi:hypothetical protein